MLKNYEDNQKAVIPKPPKPKKSGVACTELKCKGEMMIQMPQVNHPELDGLRRAVCGKCGWRGWV